MFAFRQQGKFQCTASQGHINFFRSLYRKDQKIGFTLIETLIVISIVMILSAVAMPSLKHLIISDRLQSVSFQIVQDLREVREDAILYQQNLRVYFCVDPKSSRNFYFLERYQKDPLNKIHYTPGDPPDGRHFVKRVLKYNIFFGPHHPFKPFGWINGKQYYYVEFFSGAGSHFRGQPNAFDHITLFDKNSGMKYFVILDPVGRARMYGSIPSSP